MEISIPKNLDETFELLDELIDLHLMDMSEETFVSSTHHSIVRWIRNNWKLWEEDFERNPLVKWFDKKEIKHADDMSAIILTSYYRKKHNLLINLDEQIQKYIKYWNNKE